MNKNFNELTVVLLREEAKRLGIKGYSKMKKAELVESLNNANTNKVEIMNGVVEMEMNKGLVNGANEDMELGINFSNYEENVMEDAMDLEAIKSIDLSDVIEINSDEDIEKLIKLCKKNDLDIDYKKINKVDAIERQAIINRIAVAASRQRKMGFNIIKKESKAIRTISMIRVEFGVKAVNREIEAYSDVYVQPAQESSLVRACEIKEGKLADKVMVADGLFVDEVITVSFARSLLGKSKRVKRLFNKVMDSLFSNPNNPLDNSRKSLMIKFNAITGVATKVDEVGTLADEEVVVEYEFMGITPSGLRSASIICAATRRHTNKGTVNVDRRVAILEEAMDGAFSCNFLDGDKFRTVKSLEKLFKDSTRITQCAPGSQIIMDVDNYVVVENIALEAKFNGKPATSVTDGNIRIATQALLAKYYRPNGIPVTFEEVNGTCAQYRGASLKCSGTATKRRDVISLAKKMISYENEIIDAVTGEKTVETNVAFIVVDGVRMTRDEFLALSFEEREAFFNKIDLLGDMNAFKLEKFNPVFKLVKLKEAYASDSESNMVVNMAMLHVAPEEAKAFLIRKAKEQLCARFKKLGVSFELNSNGMPIPTQFKLESTNEYNNASQFIDYIFNCDRDKIAKMLPAVLRSVVANEIKGMRRIVNELKVDLDSKYMVVQSDMAALYGQTILQENECFCKDFTVKQVSGVRHPISSIFAVTTFNVVTLTEILERINRLPVGDSTKNAIADFYIYAKGYVVLPASEYLMEKHDGMDWDIDAMQFILDQEAVAILKRLPNIGSNISKDNDWMRKCTLNAETNIANENFVRPEVEKTAPERVIKSSMMDIAEAVNRVKNNIGYNYAFDNVGKYVARKFFSSDVANVGEIATAFYNNVCILSALISTEIDDITKNAIVKEFNTYYKCSGKAEYKSVIVKTIDGDKITYNSNKMDCCEAIFRFAESNGTAAELIEFLMDCIYLNRFLAETSIDAAKNMFFIMNMFKHSDFVRALGSDKNMDIVVTEDKEQSNEIYANRFSALGLQNAGMNSNNFFNIEMLTTEIKGVTLDQLEVAREKALEDAAMNNRKPSPVALAITDPLAVIRKELVTFANDLIVIYTKLAESEVTSLEGAAMREFIINAAESLENKAEIRTCLYAINNAYATITTCAKNVDTFEDKAAKDYMNTVAIQACRNMATLGLAGIDEYSIGLYAVSLMCNTDGTSTINPALLKVLEREIVTFLSSIGVNNIGMIGETLMYAKRDGKMVKISNLVGLEVSMVNGKAYLEDGTIVVAKDKKATIEGTITETDYGFAIVGERKYTEDNLSVGAYFGVDNRNANQVVGKTNCRGRFIPVSYSLCREYKVGNIMHFNVVVAYNAEGQYKIVGKINANSNIASVLESMELTTDNFKVFTNANGRTVFFLGGKECEAILSAINVDNEFSFEGDLVAPELDLDLSIESEEFVAPSQDVNNEFYFDENQEFGLPQ